MKIEFKNVETTLKTITNQDKFKAILFYGDDNSSVTKKYKTVLNNFIKNGYEQIDISPENLKENSSLLVEEFFSVSMFSNNSIYTLRLLEKENSFTNSIENLFKCNGIENINNFLLITANGLDTTSSLRKYAEKSNYIACIGCYEEDNKNIQVLINKILKDKGFLFNSDVIEYIYQNIGNNSLIIENEIEKISLYKADDKNLTINDVKKCIVDISETDINSFCNNFCSLNKIETFRSLQKIFCENIELIVLIRMLVKYFIQLQKMRFLLDKGDTIENIFKIEKVFWKQQNIMKIHLQKWNLNNINKILEELLKIEKTIKFSQNKNIEFENFVLKSMLYFHSNINK